jgi:adenosylhomocysteinase
MSTTMDMTPLNDLTVQAKSRVKDITQSAYGRKEYDIAEVEMPGLMSTRAEFKGKNPLAGANITGSLHMTIQTGALIETLASLGAKVRWASCNIFSTQDHAAAGIAGADTAKVFAWKGETLPEYWWCTYQALRWPDSKTGGPDMIVDDGGDATTLVHEGVAAEKVFKETGKYPDVAVASCDDEYCILYLLKKTIDIDPQMWTKIAAGIVGVSEETTTGVHRIKEMADAGKLLFPAININDSVTKSKFDNVYGCRHSLPDGIMRATDVMLAGKTVLVCGYGDVGKGSAQAMKNCGANVIVAEIDPICALQACMEGFRVLPLKDVVGSVDVIITTTGNKDIIMLEDMKKMKNNCIVGNIGHFDNEIDMKGLYADKTTTRINIKAGTDRFVFEDGHGIIILAEGRLLNLGCATGHPSFVMSCSFTNQALAQLELWEGRLTKKYDNLVYLIPKHLDEKVARLHLAHLGAKLTVLTKDQAEYLHIKVEGPYKPETYRY